MISFRQTVMNASYVQILCCGCGSGCSGCTYTNVTISRLGTIVPGVKWDVARPPAIDTACITVVSRVLYSLIVQYNKLYQGRSWGNTARVHNGYVKMFIWNSQYLLTAWRHKEPRHHQPYHWPIPPPPPQYYSLNTKYDISFFLSISLSMYMHARLCVKVTTPLNIMTMVQFWFGVIILTQFL